LPATATKSSGILRASTSIQAKAGLTDLKAVTKQTTTSSPRLASTSTSTTSETRVIVKLHNVVLV
jgi:hypothetical protein